MEDQVALLLLDHFSTVKLICQLSQDSVPHQTFADISIWMYRDLSRFGSVLKRHYQNSKRYPAARNTPLEKLYDNLMAIPGAAQLFSISDNKQAALAILKLDKPDEFVALVEGLKLRGLDQQIPHFWLEHARSYGGLSGPSFEEWFYHMTATDSSFLSKLADNLRFVKSSYSVLWDYLSNHKLFYLFADCKFQFGKDVLQLVSAKGNKFSHNGRSAEITATHIIIDGRQVLPQDLFEGHLSCTVAKLFELYDANFGQVKLDKVDRLDRVKGDDQPADNNTCCICLENQAQVTLMPCGHLCVCIGCHNDHLCAKPICPLCQKQLAGSIKTFY